jgi:putative tricarboxylic transport membrane protein
MNRWEKAAGIVLLAMGIAVAVYAWSSLKLGMVVSPDAGFLPFFLGVLLVILASVWLVKDGLLAPASAQSGAERFFPEGRWRKLLLVLAVVVAYAGLLERIGYLLATLAFLVAWQFGVERERWLKAAAISAIGTAALYLLFRLVLRVPLPQGSWLA